MWLIHTPGKSKERQLINIDKAVNITTEGRCVFVRYGNCDSEGQATFYIEDKIVCDSEEQAAFYIEDIYQAIGQKKAVWDEQAAKQRFRDHKLSNINMFEDFKRIL